MGIQVHREKGRPRIHVIEVLTGQVSDEYLVSADTARAYKPHREIFDEALRVSGCMPNEVVHIGDSYDTDVVGARSAGIRPVLLLRGHARQHDDVDAVGNLEQVLDLGFNSGLK